MKHCRMGVAPQNGDTKCGSTGCVARLDNWPAVETCAGRDAERDAQASGFGADSRARKDSLAYISDSRQPQDSLASAKAEHARVVAETSEIQQRAADAQAMLDGLRGRITDHDLKIAAAQVAGSLHVQEG